MKSLQKRISRVSTLPLLALRGLVVFPQTSVTFDVGREKSIAALQEAMAADQCLFLVSQKDIGVEDPTIEQLHKTGVVVRISQVLHMPSNSLRVMVEAQYRARIRTVIQNEPVCMVEVKESQPRLLADAAANAAYRRECLTYFERYAALSGEIDEDSRRAIAAIKDTALLVDRITDRLPAPAEEKQPILDALVLETRLQTLLKLLASEVEILELERGIEKRVQTAIDKNQRDYYLHEQMKVIASELGEEDDPMGEAEELRRAVRERHLPDDVEQKLLKECDKLSKMPFGSHEATVVRLYLDTCLSLPWGQFSKERLDLEAASRVLERDHYGLKKVKERILELLAVRCLTGGTKGQVICLVGPPGVGKTSIAKSVAEALGRAYVRVSLGGVRDEAEIRGHRRTYIGSKAGRIIEALIQAKTSNPVVLLDEIDKLASSHNGDPSSALLEVLDTEQNVAFRDHYLELPYDLSQVLFITTANTAEDIPAPLYDRMDVITLSSYTAEEKFHIARDHLIKKQLKLNGLNGRQLRITDEAVRLLIDGYTREGGVRNLERSLATLCRKSAQKIVSGEAKSLTIRPESMEQYLGPRRFKDDETARRDEIGVVNGLAWTAVGGETMPVEVAVLDGTGKLELTGSLGDVMKESARAAISYVRSRADRWNIAGDFYKTKDIHIHVPEGAVPKDGPSAGVTMATAMVSALTGIPVRHDVAMTGEISLRGRVLPIGGLKEKTMAAYRHNLTTVVIPKANEPDLAEIDDTVKGKLRFVTAQTMDTVIETALALQ
ncbi:MAG: endopeptidase La [Clostridia bacterium]|nr:endopeptidase La [Clostridia bacterium]